MVPSDWRVYHNHRISTPRVRSRLPFRLSHWFYYHELHSCISFAPTVLLKLNCYLHPTINTSFHLVIIDPSIMPQSTSETPHPRYPNLLSPLTMGSLTIPNRVIMAPMTRGRAGPSLKANALMAEHYTQRASSGLIIAEGSPISIMARGWFEGPDMFSPGDVKAWKQVTDSVHEAGGKIFAQL